MKSKKLKGNTEARLTRRLESLDALRGFDMFWITGGAAIFLSLQEIFPGSATQALKRQLTHVPWEGFAFWDIIMPLFLFIVGAAMPFSIAKRQEKGAAKWEIYRHVLIRFAILFVLGMVAQGHLLEFDLGRLHIFSNTLQAIAAGYLISAVFLLELKTRSQALATSGLLLVYWALMALIPIPGYGAGNMSPDGNLALYIDRWIQGPYQDQTTYTWILSSLTFAATVMLGAFCGSWLRSGRSKKQKAMGLAIAGILCMLLGWGWGFLFPIIKHLWTSSFVLYSGGMCILLLALFYSVIDVWGLRKWAFPFKVIGMNAIAVYMASTLFDFRQIGDIFVGGLEKYLYSGFPFIQSLAAFAVVWLILYFLYRQKIFIKI